MGIGKNNIFDTLYLFIYVQIINNAILTIFNIRFYMLGDFPFLKEELVLI